MNKRFLSKQFLMIIPALLLLTLSLSTNVSAGSKNNELSDSGVITISIDGCDIVIEITDSTITEEEMNEEITQCVEIAKKNHGEFVSCVADVTNGWKKAGLIDGQEKGAIQRCAAHADIPPVSDLKCKENTDCDDGAYCNGTETCVDKVCQSGTPACPDDGLFCTGIESCDEATDACISSGDPCASPLICIEDTDECQQPGEAVFSIIKRFFLRWKQGR